MTRGRFAHRVQAALLVQDILRLTHLRGIIDRQGGYYVVLLIRPGRQWPPTAILHAWSDWEAWKLDHPEQVLGQLSFPPPTE